ncbi:hypothetical protein [Corynebacterium sp. 212_CJEI]|uniref:hypothetical protein n=1 Tax=Corynebacterium sp. 212_CJEI TaxID=2715675 RepID=UPI0006651870|nr:hypothetical protein [Corynebacterium sp. 212_CJEI]
MTQEIAINIETTRHAAEETRAIAADLRQLADDTVAEMLAAVRADFSQASVDGGVSPMFAEPLAAAEAALERWRVGHYAYADSLDRAAAGLDATANGAEAAETDAVAAAGRVEPGAVTSSSGPDYTHLVESAVREPDRGPDLTHLVEGAVREPAPVDYTAEAESAVRGPLAPGDDIPHEWRNDEALAAHARRGVDTSEAGSRVGPTIDGDGERVEKTRRAVSWTQDAFAVPLHTD